MTSDGTATSLTAILELGVYSIRVTAINVCGKSVPSHVIAFSCPIPQLRPAAR